MNRTQKLMIVGENEELLWSNLVNSHADRNLFYQLHWDEFFIITFGRMPVRVILVRGDQPLAFAKIFLFQSPKDPLGLSRSLTSGWNYGWGHTTQILPVSSFSEQEFTEMVSGIEEIGKKQGCSFASLYFSPEIESKWFEKLGYEIRKRERISIDLTKSEAQLFGSMSRNCRRNIKKAESKGMRISEAKNKHELISYYQMVIETCKRVQIPLEKFELYKSAWEHLVKKNLGRLFIARIEDKTVGGVFIFQYKDTAFGWSAATSSHRNLVAPGHFMHWNIIRTLKRDGFKTYDIGERWSPQDERGIIRFKRELGANFTRCLAAEKIINRTKYFIANQIVTPIYHKAVEIRRKL